MNIKFENNSDKTKYFRDILEGECFVVYLDTPDQTICMKTFNGDIEGNTNAVNLQNGENYYIENDVRVVPLNAELKVWFLEG